MIDETVKETSEDGRVLTVFDYMKAGMTLESFLAYSVRLVWMNGHFLGWLTSSGQVFPYDQRQEAIEFEKAYLMQPVTE